MTYSTLPASKAIALHLRQAISAGDYLPGDRLPSQRELAQTYGVAMNTAREACRLLAEGGLIIRQQGRGVFVTKREESLRNSPEQRIAQLEAEILQLKDRLDRVEAEALS